MTNLEYKLKKSKKELAKFKTFKNINFEDFDLTEVDTRKWTCIRCDFSNAILTKEQIQQFRISNKVWSESDFIQHTLKVLLFLSTAPEMPEKLRSGYELAYHEINKIGIDPVITGIAHRGCANLMIVQKIGQKDYWLLEKTVDYLEKLEKRVSAIAQN